MIKTAILISPECKAAYFADYKDVAKAELEFTLPHLKASIVDIGPLSFLHVNATEADIPSIMRLSLTQGIFEVTPGDSITPKAYKADFYHHNDLVFGSKFRGKTNERLTQMLINISLAALGRKEAKLLDPMCGRATTLFWALRYGLKAKGIEKDPKALQDIMQIGKKWTTVHGEKLSFKEGFQTKKNKSHDGKFLEIKSPYTTMKVVIGDSSNSPELLNFETFDIILADIPYGIEHRLGKHKSSLKAPLSACIPKWEKVLKKDGVLTIAFNSYTQKKNELDILLKKCGLKPLNFSAGHRMSESILREVRIYKRSL